MTRLTHPTTHTHPPKQAHRYREMEIISFIQSVSGLVVKSIVAIDGPRVRFAADAKIHSVEIVMILTSLFLDAFHIKLMASFLGP